MKMDEEALRVMKMERELNRLRRQVEERDEVIDKMESDLERSQDVRNKRVRRFLNLIDEIDAHVEKVQDLIQQLKDEKNGCKIEVQDQVKETHSAILHTYHFEFTDYKHRQEVVIYAQNESMAESIFHSQFPLHEIVNITTVS